MKWLTNFSRESQPISSREVDPPTNHPGRKRWSTILRIVWWAMFGLLVAIMAFLVWQSRDILLVTLRTARYYYFAWTFVVYTIAIGFIAFGWHLVMSHLGGQGDLIVNIKIYVYTLAARRVPGTIWYIAGRVILYKHLGVARRVTSLVSGVEVILSVISGLLVGMPALFLQMGISAASITIFSSVVFGGLCLLHPKVLSWLLARFSYDVELGRITIWKVFSWLGAYVSMWISGGLMIYTVIVALYPLDPSFLPLVISFWSLTGVIAFATLLLPNNLGIPEITLSVLLAQIIPWPIAIVTSVLNRVLTTIFDLMWSSLFLWEKNRSDKSRRFS